MRQSCGWLEYDAAELEGNERKMERTIEGEGVVYLSRTGDILGRAAGNLDGVLQSMNKPGWSRWVGCTDQVSEQQNGSRDGNDVFCRSGHVIRLSKGALSILFQQDMNGLVYHPPPPFGPPHPLGQPKRASITKMNCSVTQSNKFIIMIIIM